MQQAMFIFKRRQTLLEEQQDNIPVNYVGKRSKFRDCDKQQ
jgi:hypothetical protein